MNEFEDMRGKVFIVTGGAGASAGGTGAAICRRLIACGAQVAVWDIADEAGQAMKPFVTSQTLTVDGGMMFHAPMNTPLRKLAAAAAESENRQ